MADDHAVFRTGLRQLFQNYTDITIVAEADTGEKLVTIACAERPDVALVDIDMPGAGGVAATKRMLDLHLPCRVILLTGYSQYIESGIHAGACGYVLKDSDIDVIVTAIRHVYQGGVYVDQAVQPLLVAAVRYPELRMTDRESTILQLVATGTPNREIGQSLGLSERTIKDDLTAIFAKLGARDRTHAVVIAMQRGLIQLKHPGY
ncbi:MAG: response regulator transcription factor [Blastochloris sp.]|nr:response regulator transcription factor [Blastochloris sp.]